MAKGTDWLPHGEAQLAPLMAFWRTKLSNTAVRADFNWDMDDCVPVITAITAFLDALEAYKTSPTNGNRILKDDLKAAAAAEMRIFARKDIRFNPLMNTAQKLEYGVREADREPTPIHAPVEGPDSEAALDSKTPGVLSIRYKGAKPYGVDRIEIAYKLSNEMLDSPDQLTEKETFPHNPWEHTFPHEDRGKKLYYALRYLAKENTSRWSEVKETFVP